MIELEKYDRMIRFKDLNMNGLDLLDEFDGRVKAFNELEGVAIVDGGLYWKLNSEGTEKEELFCYSESTIKKKLRKEGWEK